VHRHTTKQINNEITCQLYLDTRYTDIGPELQPRSVNAIYYTWECPLYHLTDKRRRITPNQAFHRVPHLILVSKCR
jgi:hypothetical protein